MSVHLKGVGKKLEREHNDRAWLAWHIEALRRQKRLPKLEKLLVKATARIRQTWQQQMAIMNRWVSMTRLVASMSRTKSEHQPNQEQSNPEEG